MECQLPTREAVAHSRCCGGAESLAASQEAPVPPPARLAACGPQAADAAAGAPAPPAVKPRSGSRGGGSGGSAPSCGGALASSLLRFDASLEQPVEGRLIRQGDLLMLDGEENRMKRWTVLLFSNGFYTVPHGGGELQSFAWSPFSEVREVSSATSEDKCSGFGGLPAFTLYLFSQNLGFVFAPWGEGAVADRRRWCVAMSWALQAFTRSLFPPFTLAVNPLPGVRSTQTRILAGYLLREEDGCTVSVPYCELHANQKGKAVFAMYENGSCERLERNIMLTVASPILDRDQTQSGCFSIEGLYFCGRTFQEKHLWMRALRNVKVKLLNGAPDPTAEDLLHWRASVLERAASVAAEEELDGTRGVRAQGVLNGVAAGAEGRLPATPCGQQRRPAGGGLCGPARGTPLVERPGEASPGGPRTALHVAEPPPQPSASAAADEGEAFRPPLGPASRPAATAPAQPRGPAPKLPLLGGAGGAVPTPDALTPPCCGDIAGDAACQVWGEALATPQTERRPLIAAGTPEKTWTTQGESQEQLPEVITCDLRSRPLGPAPWEVNAGGNPVPSWRSSTTPALDTSDPITADALWELGTLAKPALAAPATRSRGPSEVCTKGPVRAI